MSGSPELPPRTEEKMAQDLISEEMVFCSKCGQRYNKHEKKCPNCGEKNHSYKKPKKKVWKIIGIIAAVLVGIIIIGSLFGSSTPHYIGDRSIQHDENTHEFTLLFSFKDSNEKNISANATFNITIINDDGQTVYTGTKKVTTSDFGTWTSPLYGERYLGSLKISDSEIEKGSSSSGVIKFTVDCDGKTFFDESIVDIAYDLPITQATLSYPSLPIEVGESSYFGNERIRIDSIRYEIDEYSGTSMDIYISGEKLQGDGYCDFNYRIVDSEGYVVDSGMGMIDRLNPGDKFKDEQIYVYNIKPGESYTLELSNYSY